MTKTIQPGIHHLYNEAVSRGEDGWFVPVTKARTLSGEPSTTPTLETMKREYDALEADLKDAEDRGDRFFQAMLRALPGHYRSVLWFHFTVNRDSIYRKFDEWRESDKNTVAPFDAEHWFRVFGLEDGDWVKGDSKDESEGLS